MTKSFLYIALLFLLAITITDGQNFDNIETETAKRTLSDADPNSCSKIMEDSRFWGTCCSLNSTTSDGCVINVANGWCMVRGGWWTKLWNSTDDRVQCPPSEYAVEITPSYTLIGSSSSTIAVLTASAAVAGLMALLF